jgi:phage/plasmid primase-like uncharacterized protein
MSNELSVAIANVCIKQLAEQHGHVTWRGNRCKALWRGGDSPSVQYNARSNTLHDYVTKETYNPYTFLTKVLAWTESEARRELLWQAGLPSDDGTPFDSKAAAERRIGLANRREAERKREEKEAGKKQLRYEEHALLYANAYKEGSSPYLIKKQVMPFFETHTFEHRYTEQDLLVPVRTVESKTIGYQRIYGNDKKLFSGRCKGGFTVLYPKELAGYFVDSKLPNSTQMARLLSQGYELGICEGLATGMSCCMAKPKLIMVCAFNNGNIKPVTRALRKHLGYYRTIKGAKQAINITIWADDDRLKSGTQTLEKVMEIALLYQCQVRLPNFASMDLSKKPTDFNDILIEKGAKSISLTKISTSDVKLAFNNVLSKLNYSKDRDISLNVLDNVDTRQKIICIKAPMGTGKTKLMAEAIRKLKEQGLSVLVVGHRKTLLKALSKKLDLNYYEEADFQFLPTISRLAITFDSFWKLRKADGGLPHFDVIILDESEQVLSHITGEHIDKKAASFDVFCHYMASSQTIIAADAHLGNITKKTIKGLAPSKEIHYISHNYEAGRKKTITFTQHKGATIGRIYKDIQQGKNVFVTTDSIKFTRALGETLKRQGIKALIINSETVNDPDVKAYIENPTEEALKYQIILTSPSAQTALSDESGYWYVVYGLFENTFITSKETMQAISRARGCDNIIIWVKDKINPVKSEDELLKIYAKKAEHEDDVIKDARYIELKVRVEHQNSRDRWHLRYLIAKEATLLGYNAKVEPLISLNQQQTKQEKEELSNMKDFELEIYSEDRASAADIGDKKRIAFSKAEKFSIDKRDFVKAYALPDSSKDELKERIKKDDHGKGLALLRAYELGLGFVEPPKNDTKMQGDVIPYKVKQAVSEAFYEFIGLNLETEAEIAKLYEQAQDTRKELEARKKQIEAEIPTHYKTSKESKALRKELTLLNNELAQSIPPSILKPYDANTVKDSMFYKLILQEALALGEQITKLIDNPIRLIGHFALQAGLRQVEISRGKANNKGTRLKVFKVDENTIFENSILSRPRRENLEIVLRTTMYISIYNRFEDKVAEIPCQTAQDRTQENPIPSNSVLSSKLEGEPQPPASNSETIDKVAKEQQNTYSLHTVNNHDEAMKVLAVVKNHGRFDEIASHLALTNGELLKTLADLVGRGLITTTFDKFGKLYNA